MATIQDQDRPFEREITRQEQRFLMSPISHISLVARLRGEIREVALRQAVDKMLITYPLFGVRIEQSEDVITCTSEGAVPVPVKVYDRDSDDTWLSALNEEHSIPLRLSQGPLTRFILVKGLDVSELIVFCHHTICDGRSLELALREILLHLDDPTREPPVMPLVPAHTPEIFPEDVKPSKIRNWFIGRLNKTWAQEKVLFDEEDQENLWQAFWKNSSYCVESVLLDRDETTRLIEVCREHGVTVNSVLNVALVKARTDVIAPYDGKVKASTAVDTRERLRVEVGHAVGLYAGGVKFKFDYNEDRPFWENVRLYHETVHKTLKDNNVFGPIFDQLVIDPTFFDGMLFAMLGDQVESHQSRYDKISEFAAGTKGLLAKYFETMDSKIPDVITTNIGRLGIPAKIRGVEVDRVFFTPSSGLKMELVSGVATGGGKLTLTLNYYKGYIDGDNIRTVRDRTEEILKGLIG